MQKIFTHILIIIILACGMLSGKQLKPGSGDHKKYLEAKEQYDRGEYDRAREILYPMSREYRHDAQFNYLLGMTFVGIGGVNGRVHAQKYLKRAVDICKDSTDWRYQLGLVQVEGDLRHPAYLEFKKIIETDSNYLNAYLQVIDFCIDRYFYNEDRDRLEEAYRTILIAEKRFPGNKPVLFKKALAASLFKVFDTADEAISKIDDPDTLQKEIYLQDAYIKYNLRQFDKSRELFLKGFELMDSAEVTAYNDISLLFSPQGQRDFGALDSAECRAYADSAWQIRDPDRTTSINEKKLEHFARVYMADLMFSQPNRGKRGWETDQGKLFIRYGPPQFSEWRLPEDGDMDLNCSWKWIYYMDGEVYDIEFKNIFGGNSYMLTPMDMGNSEFKAYEMTAEVPEQQAFAEKRDLIDAVFSNFVYKGDDGQAMLDLFVATPYNQFEYEPVEGHAVCDIEYRLAFYDQSDSVLNRTRDSQQLVISPTLSRNPEFYNFHTIRMPAPSENLTVACAIEQKSAQRVNLYEMPLEIYDFSDDGFHLSSLILGSEISEKEKDTQFDRRDYKLIPNYTSTYEQGDTLIVYYEIYDLPTDLRGRTRYLFTYSIREINPPANLFGTIAGFLSNRTRMEISHTTQRGDVRSDLYEPLRVDLADLEPGLYEFSLTIEEQILGKTLTRTAPFSLIKRGE